MIRICNWTEINRLAVKQVNKPVVVDVFDVGLDAGPLDRMVDVG